MILSVFNLFLFIVEVLQLCLQIMMSFAQQILKCFVPADRKSVEGRIILITGAGSGIGRQLALRLAKMNAILVLWDIDHEHVVKTAQMIAESGGTAHHYTIDVSDEKKVQSMAADVRKKIGKVYMLINNAGIVPCLPLQQLSNHQIRRTFEVNVLAHFWTVRSVLPMMEELGEGHIVGISSSAGIMGTPYFTAYSATKHGVVGFMSSLAKELHELQKDSFIKLTTICPLGISGTSINVPTRTRFPNILPIMTLNFAVDQMLDGILKEESFIIIPFTFKVIYFVLRMCPDKVSQLIFQFLDYAIEPPGSHAPIGRSHYVQNGTYLTSLHANNHT